jgi:hypothetical protein
VTGKDPTQSEKWCPTKCPSNAGYGDLEVCIPLLTSGRFLVSVSVCFWNTYSFVAQLMRDVINNYDSTYVPSTTSRHISSACSFPTSFLSECRRGFIDEWLIWPLVLTKVTTDCYVHFLQNDLSIPIEGAPLHDRLIMQFAQLWSTKIGGMAVRRLVVDVRMPRLPVRQTLNLLITACRDTWRG